MNYADIKELDIQDGDGARVSIYVSGCHFHCKECHNKEAWDFNYGKEFGQAEIDRIIDLMDNDYISGLSILGGEPLELVNQKGLVPLVNQVKERFPNKTIWCYTGYDFEKDVLNDMYKKFSFTKELVEKIDIMVDGQFEIDKKITDLKFRGSYNQRKIDVKASLKSNSLVKMAFGDEARYEGKEEKMPVKNPKIIWITSFAKEKEKKAKIIEPVQPVYVQHYTLPKEQKIELIHSEEFERIAAKSIVR